jgi:type IV secretory pathway VirB10-like protein
MLLLRLISFGFLAACSTVAACQDSAPVKLSAEPSLPQTIALTVPKYTPLQIALDKEVRVKKVGQPIHGRLVQPVYAFDHLVAPTGTEVRGRITKIGSLTAKKRMLGILNADFTPARKVEVEFTELKLAEGKQIPIRVVVTPGSGHVMQLVSTKEEKKKTSAKSAASEKVDQAKQEAKRQWQEAMRQIKEPGKMHRLERYAVSQLPVRPQYIPAGTLYSAELQEPLDFGGEPVTPPMIASIGTPPPEGSLIRALLVTPLDSATTKKGDAVEAVIAQPVFDGNRLILPEGSRLKGSVAQVRPAGRFHHNGQLRIAFRHIVPPDGVAQSVVAGLEGVEAEKSSGVRLDSEGGAEATSSKTRYLSTGITVALAATAFREHNDADDVGQPARGGDGVGGGAAGFKLVGIALGAAIKSQPFGMAMGAYGAGRSVYSHFIARGQDVVFPKNTAMEIGIGSRDKNVLKPSGEQNGSQQQPKEK